MSLRDVFVVSCLFGYTGNPTIWGTSVPENPIPSGTRGNVCCPSCKWSVLILELLLDSSGIWPKIQRQVELVFVQSLASGPFLQAWVPACVSDSHQQVHSYTPPPHKARRRSKRGWIQGSWFLRWRCAPWQKLCTGNVIFQIYTCIYTYTNTSTSAYTCTCTNTYCDIYICIYMYMYLYIYIYIYVYTHYT